MIVLALDTALNATSVAVLDGGKVLAARSEQMERGHQERLGGLVRDTTGAAGVGFGALHRIGVTIGPGSFTGVRVGLAFAKGLSLALGVPCVGVGTLEALAASVEASGLIAVAVDARRGQVYLQLFLGGEPLMRPEALPVAEAQARLDDWRGKPVTLVGSGAPLLMHDHGTHVSDRLFPDPVALARLAMRAAEPIARPEPLYLRAPDAKTIAERAAAR